MGHRTKIPKFQFELIYDAVFPSPLGPLGFTIVFNFSGYFV